MNRREVFDKVKKHLLTQMKKCYSSDVLFCRYRHGDLKCAIGALIPDAIYSPNMEGKNVGRLLHSSVEVRKALDVDPANLGDVQFLADLQSVHDLYEPHQWATMLDIYERIYFKEVADAT